MVKTEPEFKKGDRLKPTPGMVGAYGCDENTRAIFIEKVEGGCIRIRRLDRERSEVFHRSSWVKD
jgi:hypothetical protein